MLIWKAVVCFLARGSSVSNGQAVRDYSPVFFGRLDLRSGSLSTRRSTLLCAVFVGLIYDPLADTRIRLSTSLFKFLIIFSLLKYMYKQLFCDIVTWIPLLLLLLLREPMPKCLIRLSNIGRMQQQ